MAKPNNYLYHICLNPAGVSAMQIVEVLADSIEGEEIFGPGVATWWYIKLKLDSACTVGQFQKAPYHVEAPCLVDLSEKLEAITTIGSKRGTDSDHRDHPLRR